MITNILTVKVSEFYHKSRESLTDTDESQKIHNYLLDVQISVGEKGSEPRLRRHIRILPAGLRINCHLNNPADYGDLVSTVFDDGADPAPLSHDQQQPFAVIGLSAELGNADNRLILEGDRRVYGQRRQAVVRLSEYHNIADDLKYKLEWAVRLKA